MTGNVVNDIAKGLQLGHLLQLSKDLSFGISHMSDLIVSDRCIRSFKELWQVQIIFCFTHAGFNIRLNVL